MGRHVRPPSPNTLFEAEKSSCVYCNMSGKTWVGRSGFFFFFCSTHLHILAVTMLHQHNFVYLKET